MQKTDDLKIYKKKIAAIFVAVSIAAIIWLFNASQKINYQKFQHTLLLLFSKEREKFPITSKIV